MTSSPSSAAVSPTHFEAVTQFLTGVGIRHQLIEHEPVISAAAEARATHEPPDRVAKTIVLHDGSAYVIVAIPASERLALGKLRQLLGATRRLQFASEQQIARDFPAMEVGAVPPFGPMVPAAEIIDVALLRHEQIVCPAGDHRHSVLVDPQDVVRITAARTAAICQD